MTQTTYEDLPYRPNVGLMVLNKAGEVFTGFRLDTKGLAWQMPQGGIDKGETPINAAFRELEEETGITADLVEIITESPQWLAYDFPEELGRKLWKGRYRGQKQRWFLMRFLGEDRQINIQTAVPEFAKWCWMPVDQLVENIVPFKRGIYQNVIDGFAGHL